METGNLRGVLIGVVAGLAGYYTYQKSGPVQALVVLFTAGWMIYRFSSAENTWNTFGILLNPFMTTIVFFLVGFSYSAINGDTIVSSLIIASIAAIFGAVFSQFIYRYWNIGS